MTLRNVLACFACTASGKLVAEGRPSKHEDMMVAAACLWLNDRWLPKSMIMRLVRWNIWPVGASGPLGHLPRWGFWSARTYLAVGASGLLGHLARWGVWSETSDTLGHLIRWDIRLMKRLALVEHLAVKGCLVRHRNTSGPKGHLRQRERWYIWRREAHLVHLALEGASGTSCTSIIGRIQVKLELELEARSGGVVCRKRGQCSCQAVCRKRQALENEQSGCSSSSGWSLRTSSLIEPERLRLPFPLTRSSYRLRRARCGELVAASSSWRALERKVRALDKEISDHSSTKASCCAIKWSYTSPCSLVLSLSASKSDAWRQRSEEMIGSSSLLLDHGRRDLLDVCDGRPHHKKQDEQPEDWEHEHPLLLHSFLPTKWSIKKEIIEAMRFYSFFLRVGVVSVGLLILKQALWSVSSNQLQRVGNKARRRLLLGPSLQTFIRHELYEYSAKGLSR
ncbi:hypothetical protein DY000_02025822 [Brassica cretica]|uniref:Uncharacterized protein n=2 Tax=Brassica cretica TaxID=69181 RepID=A0ABQ7EIX7_BRACR|nr:hypothetical protein DY000_02025822 [Brassica cretica]